MVIAVVASLVLLSGCQLAFDAPGQTLLIEKVDESTADGWRFEFFRNRAYPCSQPNPDGSTGYQTFVIGTRVGEPDTETRPLWVFLRGGGSGWVEPDGTAFQNGTNMREEPFADVRQRLLQGGLMARVRDHPAGFRGLAVSMCNRDTYGGSNNPDPNNFTPEGDQRFTNGLLATKAAIEFTRSRVATSDFFLHGGSAGSAGTYHVAYSMETKMGASDCKNELLRAVIEGPTSDGRSLALGVCVTSAGSTIPCDIHVTSNRNLLNTDPAHPADYISTIVDWVEDRLAEP
jgi:hypothetical protein